MDSPWDDDATQAATSEADWTKMSSEFTNTGYREGITAGKESALQEGFDSGFAKVGSPIGRELGILRGISSALLALLSGSSSISQSSTISEQDPSLAEARDIASQLSNVRFSEIAPRDLEAEAHAREHLELEGNDDDDDGVDVNEEIAEKRKMEGLEDMLEKLTAGSTTAAQGDRPKFTMEDVQQLKHRLGVLCTTLGFSVNWS